MWVLKATFHVDCVLRICETLGRRDFKSCADLLLAIISSLKIQHPTTII